MRFQVIFQVACLLVVIANSIGDHPVHPNSVLDGMVYETANYEITPYFTMSTTMLRYVRQKPESFMWVADNHNCVVQYYLLQPTFSGLSAPTNVQINIMNQIVAKPNQTYMNSVVTDSTVPMT